jgi:catechol 2,3-dioxygenase-like lactoylglutathione lyase family enzyme
MGLTALNHVSLCTTRVAELRRFYVEVLGLREGPRPNFSFGGAWLYCGDRPVVHLIEKAEMAGLVGDLRLQHFAFSAEDLAGCLTRLRELGVAYRVGVVRDFGICQINLRDPDGNHLHLDFPQADADALGLEPTPKSG